MNIKTLNEVATIVEQETNGLFDISDWTMFVYERVQSQNPVTNDTPICLDSKVVFIHENESRDACYILTAVIRGNIIKKDGIEITQINKYGCRDYIGEIADISGAGRLSILYALNY